MLLREIAAYLGLASESTIDVRGLSLSSHLVEPGDLFIALGGEKTHGAHFAEAAARSGAVAMLSDSHGISDNQSGLPTLVINNLRSQLGELSSWFYGDPSQRLSLMGITGTNGKTTTSFMIEAACRGAGVTTGLIGTVETRIGGERFPSVRTTPEAPELQKLLARMHRQGVTHVAMEVSSHALELGRVAGTNFAVSGFTNLSQDHLDFHGDMESYFRAKSLLFSPQYSVNAIINVDDLYGRRLNEEIKIPALTASSRGPADWYLDEIQCNDSGSRARLVDPYGRKYELVIALPGRYNLDNALMAIAVASATGLDTAALIEGLGALSGVPGRMERIDSGRGFSIIVDYAHTPDAVENLLAELREVTTGRIISVLGCGGDRDAGKRPLMGAAVAAGSDIALLTSDNPRSEDPMVILAQMEAGAKGVGQASVMVEADRKNAITQAIALAMPGDCVVIAGKGHEQGQEVGGVVTPFDDRVVAREALG